MPNEVALLGDGTIINLDDFRQALKDSETQDIAVWYAANYSKIMEAMGAAKEELLSRMTRDDMSLMPLPDGRELTRKSQTKRECDEQKMIHVEAFIREKFDKTMTLTRVKREVAPDMRQVAKARKLGNAVTEMLNEAITEIPGRPSLKVEGMTDDQRDHIIDVSPESAESE